MELFVFCLFVTLFIDISLNCFLICILSYRIYIIATRPELAAPKLTFYFRVQPKKFLCCDAFHGLRYFFYTHHRNTLYQKMYMILISSYFNKKYLKPLFNCFRKLLPRSFQPHQTKHFDDTLSDKPNDTTTNSYYDAYEYVHS